ncbi:pyruvate kinase /pyruvate kinase [Paracoccus halophilus]|uniref:Pyruvate kinase n=1 Tax=Paracoccus halophilus TaxID=376733 RepID=A0A099EVC0_9RHOB|nr:pyruvate kinase [Paracoccus halophilus]KGJ01863.1 pyruvate kinase [Paracoccus halophilus]SFA62434.1 pyruvate kinase /pyruvate kinase [Paracoccus halophilus]
MIRDRRAKIVATVGPASASPAMLRQLFENGVDTFRLNFSHGDHATHAQVIAAIRAMEADTGTPIGILQDLQGPKIRLGRLQDGARMVERGDRVKFLPAETSDSDNLPLPHPEIFASIRPGHRLFIDDGRVRLLVTSSRSERIEAEVLEGGKLSDRKGVNLPDTVLDLPVLTEKDRRDLEFGLAHGVDWVALSFVQKASDLDEITGIIDGRAGLVAKIEKPSALSEIEAIIRKADAIMVARGDLGVEIPPEEVPARQKEIIALCRRESRPVIVATQMLESMTAAPAPTRAEASDVATAIYDGADAVMLSAESATGAFPAETVAVMDRIIRSTEAHSFYARAIAASREPAASPADAIADTGAMLAASLGARAIVAYSRSGSTAARIAARRPFLPLIVLTRDIRISRRMALLWDARSMAEDSVQDYDSMVRTAVATSRDMLKPEAGDSIVILSGVPFGQSGSTNNIRVAGFD